MKPNDIKIKLGPYCYQIKERYGDNISDLFIIEFKKITGYIDFPQNWKSMIYQLSFLKYILNKITI